MTKFNRPKGHVAPHGPLAELRSSLSAHRRARVARRVLRAELAAYRTPADVNDLFAALRTADDNPTAEDMRAMLFANLETHRHRTAA